MLAVGMTFAEAVSRFNSNIAYSGLLHAVTADVSRRHYCYVTSAQLVTSQTATCFQGLFAVNKEKLISGTLTALLEREGDQKSITAVELEAQFQALRRLFASKAGFMAFTQLPKSVVVSRTSLRCRIFKFSRCLIVFRFDSFLRGRIREKVGIKVVKALKRSDDCVTHAAIDMLCALIQVRKRQA